MQPEERDLILNLFDRIRAASTQDNDPEAEQLILDLVGRDANAPYVLVQTVLLLEEALRRADERIRQLENSAAVAGSRRPRSFLNPADRGYADAPPPTMSGSSVPSVGHRPREEAPAAPPPPPSPPREERSRPQAQTGGGSFLGNALSTATGVAGGVLLADGLRGLFGSGASNDIFGRSADAKEHGDNKAGEADKPGETQQDTQTQAAEHKNEQPEQSEPAQPEPQHEPAQQAPEPEPQDDFDLGGDDGGWDSGDTFDI